MRTTNRVETVRATARPALRTHAPRRTPRGVEPARPSRAVSRRSVPLPRALVPSDARRDATDPSPLPSRSQRSSTMPNGSAWTSKRRRIFFDRARGLRHLFRSTGSRARSPARATSVFNFQTGDPSGNTRATSTTRTSTPRRRLNAEETVHRRRYAVHHRRRRRCLRFRRRRRSRGVDALLGAGLGKQPLRLGSPADSPPRPGSGSNPGAERAGATPPTHHRTPSARSTDREPPSAFDPAPAPGVGKTGTARVGKSASPPPRSPRPCAWTVPNESKTSTWRRLLLRGHVARGGDGGGRRGATRFADAWTRTPRVNARGVAGGGDETPRGDRARVGGVPVGDEARGGDERRSARVAAAEASRAFEETRAKAETETAEAERRVAEARRNAEDAEKELDAIRERLERETAILNERLREASEATSAGERSTEAADAESAAKKRIARAQPPRRREAGRRRRRRTPPKRTRQLRAPNGFERDGFERDGFGRDGFERHRFDVPFSRPRRRRFVVRFESSSTTTRRGTRRAPRRRPPGVESPPVDEAARSSRGSVSFANRDGTFASVRLWWNARAAWRARRQPPPTPNRTPRTSTETRSLAAVRGALDAPASHCNADARNLRALRAATRSVRAGATREAAFSSTAHGGASEAPRARSPAPSATSGTAGYGSGTDAETSRVAATLDRRRRADPRDEQFGGDPLKSLKSALAGVRAAEERRVETSHVARNVGGIYAHKALGPDTSAPGGSLSEGFLRAVDDWNRTADREKALYAAHGDWLRAFKSQIETAATTAFKAERASKERTVVRPSSYWSATGVGARTMSDERRRKTDAFERRGDTNRRTRSRPRCAYQYWYGGYRRGPREYQYPAATKSYYAYAIFSTWTPVSAFPRPALTRALTR